MSWMAYMCLRTMGGLPETTSTVQSDDKRCAVGSPQLVCQAGAIDISVLNHGVFGRPLISHGLRLFLRRYIPILWISSYISTRSTVGLNDRYIFFLGMFLFEIHLSPYDPFIGVVGASFLRLGATTAERRSSAPSTGTSNKDGIFMTAENLGASRNSIQAPLRRDSRDGFTGMNQGHRLWKRSWSSHLTGFS
jgi:hypothetical protein